MPGYYPAQICLNGHVISTCENNVETYCSDCGAKTISACPNCNTPIRGDYNDEYIVYTNEYKRPSYCFACGNPFPWTQSSLKSIQELIDFDKQLSEEEKSYIDNNISALTTDTPRTKVVATKLNVFLKKAGTVTVSAVRDILVDIASETAKKIIFDE